MALGPVHSCSCGNETTPKEEHTLARLSLHLVRAWHPSTEVSSAIAEADRLSPHIQSCMHKPWICCVHGDMSLHFATLYCTKHDD